MGDKVFEYENVFSLILSMVEQLSKDKAEGYMTSEKLDDYFRRLSKKTLGEYEFARRMAFEHVNVVRLAPYPILREKFNQPITMDFIMVFNGRTACVDVKYYELSNLFEKFIVEKHILDALIKFRDSFKLDDAYLAIKRCEHWYLIDAKDILAKIKPKGESFEIPFNELKTLNQLNEDCFVLNMGRRANMHACYPQPAEGTEFGIFFNSWVEKDNKIKFSFSKKGESGAKDDLALDGNSARIMSAIYRKIYHNVAFLVQNNIHPTKVTVIEDFIPTSFSVFDLVGTFKNKEELELAMKPLIDPEYIYCNKPYNNYHFGCIWSIINHNLKKEE